MENLTQEEEVQETIQTEESQDLDALFYNIDQDNLVDAKETFNEIISNKVSNILASIKQTLSGKLVSEGCTKVNGDEEVADAVAKLPKPKKAKPEVDGGGKVIEKWKPVKEESEDLNELSVDKMQGYIKASINSPARKDNRKTLNNMVGVATAANKIAKKITKEEIEDLDEKVDATKEVGKVIDRMYDKAAKNTKTVDLKSLFNKKSKE